MNSDLKVTLTLLTLTIIFGVALVIAVASYPKPQPENTIAYEGWIIYQPDGGNRTSYIATQPNSQPLSNSNLQALITVIDQNKSP